MIKKSLEFVFISWVLQYVAASAEKDFQQNMQALHERMTSHLSLQKSLGQPLLEVGEEKVKHVAIIDTGFYLNHKYLQGHFTTSGFNAVTKKSNAEITFEYKGVDKETCFARSHGTHMASIASQVVGDDNGQKIKIVPVKVGLEPLSDLDLHINALNFIAERSDIAVVSISINYPSIFHGEPDTFPQFKKALLRVIDSGKLLIIAAQNNRSFFTSASPFSQFVISSEAKGRVIVVGATQLNGDDEEAIAKFSNKAGVISSQFITAPGTNILCATYLFKDKLEDGIPDGTECASGTSHATAVVAGSLISLINHFPTLSIDEVREILFQSASKTFKNGSRRDLRLYGNGVLNLDAAYILAAKKRVFQYIKSANEPQSKQRKEKEEERSSSASTELSLRESEDLDTLWGRLVNTPSSQGVYSYLHSLQIKIQKQEDLMQGRSGTCWVW